MLALVSWDAGGAALSGDLEQEYCREGNHAVEVERDADQGALDVWFFEDRFQCGDGGLDGYVGAFLAFRGHGPGGG